MKSFVIVGCLVAAFLQVEGRSIGVNDQLPKLEREIIRETFECAMDMGPLKISQIPSLRGLRQLPEDNSALSELWGCFWKKKGIINENGVLIEDKLEQYFVDIGSLNGPIGPAELNAIHDLVQQCKNVHGDDYGQTAVKVLNCFGST